MKLLNSFVLVLILGLYPNKLCGQSNIDDMSLFQILTEAEDEKPFFQFTLGLYYETGKRLEKDRSKAKYWYEKAMNNGFKHAHSRLACLYDEEKNYTKSYPLWLSYSEKYKENEVWYNISLCRIAVCKNEALGTVRDPEGAIEYAKRAWHNNNTLGGCCLHSFYEERGDAQKAFAVAKELHEKSGLPLELAKHYLFGEGCEQNLKRVYELLLDMANGKLQYEQPSGVKITYHKEDHCRAQFYIGIANYFDKTKKNHYEEAVQWLMSVRNSTIAQRKDKGEALCLLSRCYRFGRGVKQDVSKANELQVESKKILTEEEYNNFSKHFQASY